MPTINKKGPPLPWANKKPAFEMGKKNTAFYNSVKWRKLSILFKQANPLCINYDTCAGPTEYTDHIVPINEGGAMYEPTNLQPLCRKCNAAKTGRQRWKDKGNE